MAGLRDHRPFERHPAVQDVVRDFEYAGPGAPLNVSRNAIAIMSATRSVVITIDANLVIGRHHVDVRQVL